MKSLVTKIPTLNKYVHVTFKIKRVEENVFLKAAVEIIVDTSVSIKILKIPLSNSSFLINLIFKFNHI